MRVTFGPVVLNEFISWVICGLFGEALSFVEIIYIQISDIQ